jgi:hypothetical protein
VLLAALLLLALIAAGPLWGPGLLNTRGGGDSPFLLLRVHQLAANLRTGVFPARWMPDAAYGFGYPFFSYYSALPYYLAAGFTLVGLDILSAIKLTQTLFFAATALAMYGWARRRLSSRIGGWLAAVGYTFAPYHLVNIYVRGDSLSEFAAFAFYPLIPWGLDFLAARPSLRRALFPALAYAGLVTTHNLSALVFSPFALLYLAALMWRNQRQRWHILAFGSCALGLGVMLSAWYWLPALAEAGYGQLEAQTTGYFFYGNHFRGTDLVQPGLIFDYVASPGSPSSFAAMGSVQTALVLAGGLVVIVGWVGSRSPLRNSRFEIPWWSFVLVGLLITTWLITPLSRSLWDHVPLLPMIQFPWRLLSVQGLFTAMLAGAVIAPLRRWRWAAAVVLTALLAASGLAGLRPEYLPIAAEEVTAERLHLYELFTGNIGSTIRYEYLPRWVVPRPFTGPPLFDPSVSPRAIPVDGELVSAQETVHKPTRRTWTVEAGAGGAAVAFPLYYWPGWRATVDSTPTEVGPAADSGYLTLAVPPGRHTVAMWLGRTPLRAAAEAISILAILVLLAIAVGGWRRLPSLRSLIVHHRPLVICHLTFGACLAVLIAFSPRVAHTDETDLTMDFDRMPYLHHNPDGVDLDKWRLTSYSYTTDLLAPGGVLHVAFEMEAEREGISARLSLVHPSAVRRDEAPAVWEATVPIPAGAGSASIDVSIPHDLGPGMYLVRLGGENGEGAIYLRPICIDARETATGELVSAAFADGTLQLHATEAMQSAPDRLDLRIDWSAASPVAANYKLSLRITDPAGNEWGRLDTQPGYGFLPTSLWPADRLIHDHYALPLPEGIPPGDGYTLAVILYRAAIGESLGNYAIPVSLSRATLRPDAPASVLFGNELALSQLEVPRSARQGEVLELTAYWLAVQRPSVDYVVEWRLETTGQIISRTSALAPGSPPTTWPAGAWIAGRSALPIPPTTPPGDYVLSLTLHDPVSGASPGTHVLGRPVRIEGRERTWQLPPMQREMGAIFGDPPGGMIELAGYDLEQEGDTLQLTLHWRALAVPDRHYVFFVHLADPATGSPVAQVDAMPREFTYPTGMWAPGEVISDVVRLSLKGVPAGQYELAIGWYDPETGVRLPAMGEDGPRLPDDRLVLPDGVTLP